VYFVQPLGDVGRAVVGCIMRESSSCQSQVWLVDNLGAEFARGFEAELQDSDAPCTGYSPFVVGMEFAAAADVGPVAVDIVIAAVVEAALVEVGIGTGDSVGIVVSVLGIEVAAVVDDVVVGFGPDQKDSSSSSSQE
jgi:hypothetical protein